MSLQIVKLDSCVNILSGFAFKSKYFNSNQEGMPLIRIRNVVESKIETYYSGEYDDQYLIKKGDLLVGMDGDFNRQKWNNEPALLNQRVCKITPIATMIDSSYLYHLLPKELDLIHAVTPCVTVKHLSVQKIKDIELILPSLPEQQRIADILDKAEAITQKREQALTLCDEFLRATFLDMFGDPVSNPKGWDVKKLSRFGEVITGSTPSRGKSEYYGNHIEWIKSDNINTPNNYITRAKEFLSVEGESVGRSVPENSILMTCIAGSLDCIGNIALTDRKVSFNQQINGIVPNDDVDVDVYFLYSLLLYSKKYIQNHSTNSMKGMISKGKLSEIKFYLPEMAIQKEFSDIFLKIESLRNKIQNAQELPLFDALSQQAFKGELTQ